MPRVLACFGLVALAYFWRTFGAPPPLRQQQALRERVSVALSVSGASRGALVIDKFADGLLQHAVNPALATHDFEAFVWLQDDSAEEGLCRRLRASSAVHTCAMRHVLAPSDDETAAIARDHLPSLYGSAWRGNATTNTIRMLWKLRGIEKLRLTHLASFGHSTHDWVLRVRPDLELLAPLRLPPVASAVYVPWRCASAELVFDQLLLLPGTIAGGAPGGAEALLAALYMPETLLRVALRSEPPSLYPERLVHHALSVFGLRDWPGGVDVRLLGSAGEARDAFGKLKSDFPGCFP